MDNIIVVNYNTSVVVKQSLNSFQVLFYFRYTPGEIIFIDDACFFSGGEKNGLVLVVVERIWNINFGSANHSVGRTVSGKEQIGCLFFFIIIICF